MANLNVLQALDDIRTFIQNDPLTQAVANLPVSATTRAVLADVVNALASEVYRATQEAHDQGFRDAAVPVEEAIPQ